MTQIRILFICHGNICRSAAAEMVLRQLAAEMGQEEAFRIASAATSREEIGNDIYPPMKKALAAAGCAPQPGWNPGGGLRSYASIQRGMDRRKALAESGKLRRLALRQRNHAGQIDPEGRQDQPGSKNHPSGRITA